MRKYHIYAILFMTAMVFAYCSGSKKASSSASLICSKGNIFEQCQ